SRQDVEALGCGAGDDGAAQRVHGPGLEGTEGCAHPFVPVGIEWNPSLLHHHAEEVVPRLEAEAATVEAHDALSSVLVEDAGRQADAQELPQTNLQIGLALRREQRVEGAHLALVIGTPADLVGTA